LPVLFAATLLLVFGTCPLVAAALAVLVVFAAAAEFTLQEALM
jgi:hypothetical protein